MSNCTQCLYKSDCVQAQSPAACVPQAHTQRKKVTLVFKSLERVLKRATMDDPSFAGSEKCTLCPAGTYSTLSGTTVTRFGSRFHSIYWALILRLEFAEDAIV
jgi:hypothetical protein